MSIAYKRRKKTIRDLKAQMGVNAIPRKMFCQLQANWERQVTGPPIGTLQDLMDARRG